MRLKSIVNKDKSRRLVVEYIILDSMLASPLDANDAEKSWTLLTERSFQSSQWEDSFL